MPTSTKVFGPTQRLTILCFQTTNGFGYFLAGNSKLLKTASQKIVFVLYHFTEISGQPKETFG